jgi:hypothetical protein
MEDRKFLTSPLNFSLPTGFVTSMYGHQLFKKKGIGILVQEIFVLMSFYNRSTVLSQRPANMGDQNFLASPLFLLSSSIL